MTEQGPTGAHVGWSDLLGMWDLVVLDLAAIFHIDPATTPWLRVRRLVEALPYEPASRVRRALRG